MRHLQLGFAAVTALLVFAHPGSADKKPRPAQKVGGQYLANTYNGNSWKWSKGYAYFGGGGVFKAIWEDRGYAEGKWYATQSGNVCYEAHWKSNKGEEDRKVCWSHVSDADGVVWQRSSSDRNDWYRLRPETRFERGFVFKRSFNHIKRGLGG